MVSLASLKSEVGDEPHALAGAIQVPEILPDERVRLMLEAFEASPSYGILMYLKHEFDSAGPELRAQILDRFLGYLQAEWKVANEILYTLWCDYFEDDKTVEESWAHLAGVGRPPVVLERLLPVAGPVPWELKVPLIESLIPNRRWHPYIFRCLLASQFDVFGSIEPAAARRLLGRLDVPKDEEGYPELEAKLRESTGGVA